MKRNSSIRDLLQITFKWKSYILFVFFATVLGAASYSLLSKPVYEASSKLLIKVGRENVYAPTFLVREQTNLVVNERQEEQVNSEIEILKSQFLASKVIESVGINRLYPELNSERRGVLATLMKKLFSAPSAVETGDIALSKFQENLRVEGVKKTDVIDVSFQHEDPVVAAAVLNTLISLYLDRHLDVHQDPQFSGFFEEKPKTLADELQEAEANLDAFRKQYGVSSSPDELRTLLVKEEGDVRATLNQTISQEAETEAQVKQLRAHLKKIPELVNLNKEIEHNPYAISTIRSKLIELQIRERELLNKYNSDNLLVKNVRTEMEEVLAQLSDEETKVYQRSHSGLNAIRQAIQQQLLQKEAELNALKAKSSSLLNVLSTYKQRLDELNHIEVGYYRLKQEVDVNRQNYQFYLGKFAESRISNAMDKERITNVSLIDPARPPSKPVGPKILLNLVLSIFLGGVGSFALAYGMEYFDTRLEKPEDVEAHLKLPVLASIAEFSSSSK
jgi:uncharacterized protein involved in exopolysaccharide biosynthesis